jgi:hypothetical protein
MIIDMNDEESIQLFKALSEDTRYRIIRPSLKPRVDVTKENTATKENYVPVKFRK